MRKNKPQFVIASTRKEQDGHICSFKPFLQTLNGLIERCIYCHRDEEITVYHTSYCQHCQQYRPIPGMQRVREKTYCFYCLEAIDRDRNHKEPQL